MYDNDQRKTIINIMNINTHQEPMYLEGNDQKEPMYLEGNDQEPSKPDLIVQNKVFQICKHQIESSFYNNTYTSQNVRKTEEDTFHYCQEIEDVDFHDCKEIEDADFTSLKSFQWTRTDPKATTFYTTKKGAHCRDFEEF